MPAITDYSIKVRPSLVMVNLDAQVKYELTAALRGGKKNPNKPRRGKYLE